MKKYEVKVLEKEGSCDSALFDKMAKNGDITSEKITEWIGKVVTITGYALCHITTEEKEFDMGYYATKDGMISTGSYIFMDSVKDYIDEVKTFRIVKVKTKKGTTYKVSPILVDDETGEVLE